MDSIWIWTIIAVVFYIGVEIITRVVSKKQQKRKEKNNDRSDNISSGNDDGSDSRPTDVSPRDNDPSGN